MIAAGPDASSGTQPIANDGWTLTDLGTLGGGYGNAHDVNAAGQVVAPVKLPAAKCMRSCGRRLAGWWTSARSAGGDYSTAADVNDAGQVVGFSNSSTGLFAFLWAPRPAWSASAGSGTTRS